MRAARARSGRSPPASSRWLPRSTGELLGLAASSFTVVSLEPPLVSINLATTSKTWPDLRRAATSGSPSSPTTTAPCAASSPGRSTSGSTTWRTR